MNSPANPPCTMRSALWFPNYEFPKMYNGHLLKKRGPKKRLRISLSCIFRIQVPEHEHSRHPRRLALPIRVKNAEKIEGLGVSGCPKIPTNYVLVFQLHVLNYNNQRSISLSTTSYTNIRHVTWGVQIEYSDPCLLPGNHRKATYFTFRMSVL